MDRPFGSLPRSDVSPASTLDAMYNWCVQYTFGCLGLYPIERPCSFLKRIGELAVVYLHMKLITSFHLTVLEKTSPINRLICGLFSVGLL